MYTILPVITFSCQHGLFPFCFSFSYMQLRVGLDLHVHFQALNGYARIFPHFSLNTAIIHEFAFSPPLNVMAFSSKHDRRLSPLPVYSGHSSVTRPGYTIVWLIQSDCQTPTVHNSLLCTLVPGCRTISFPALTLVSAEIDSQVKFMSISKIPVPF